MRNSQQTTKRCVKCDHIIDDPQVEGDERCAACADPGDEPALPPTWGELVPGLSEACQRLKKKRPTCGVQFTSNPDLPQAIDCCRGRERAWLCDACKGEYTHNFNHVCDRCQKDLDPVDPGEYWRDVANRLQNDVSNLDQAVVNQDRKIEELEADCARHIETALRWKRRHDEDTTRLRGERDKAGLAHIKTRKRVRKAEGILLKAHDELGDSDGVLLDALNALTPPKGG